MHTSQTTTPELLPLLPLKDIVVFPQMIIPVFVAEDICLRAVEAALSSNKLLFLSAFREEDLAARANDGPELEVSLAPPFDVYNIGTVAMVMRSRRLPDGRTKVLLQGMQKAAVKEFLGVDGHPVVRVQRIVEEETLRDSSHGQIMKNVKEMLERLVGMGKSISPDVLMLLDEVMEPGKFADLVASNLTLKISDAQKILGTNSGLERLKRVQAFLLKELESGVINARSPRDELLKLQREAFLRDQMKAIKSELSDSESSDELQELRQKIDKVGMPPEALQETMRQFRRLERMNPESSEATMARTYVEWMVDIPWNVTSESKVDLGACKIVLDEDHYGLEKIKDRVLEYLAVRKLNPNIKGPILCLVGPPGVGKTSLGRSVARALNRKFARISLGGVRDEAEIRGHRRTYVGAQPGRIVQAIRNVGVMNPVIMLDEIDKMASDYKGDPSSALLEVLDPEQNNTFSDHYLMVPFDLSQCLFIANANRLDAIPAPLRDRMEIIEVGGYCEDEKLEIAKGHVIPKMLLQHGLTSDVLQFQDLAVLLMINGYTRESGLRGLEKTIASITRKLARTIAESDEKGKERKVIKVTPKLTRELLGEESYLATDHNSEIPRVGVSTGLAYTSSGGDILEMEVNLSKGKGGLILTGQLGDVMKESAQAALSYIKSRADFLEIPAAKFSDFDVHLHAPAGAIPKDGPSAGVAICLALVSAYTGRPMRQDIAMTGEISLHGRVLPVGGLREKILAAIRADITMVLVPEKNRNAIAELPANIRRGIDIRYMKNVEEVFSLCLMPVETESLGAGSSGRSTAWSSDPVAAAGAEFI
jgi:ATP-dependent Lon protease